MPLDTARPNDKVFHTEADSSSDQYPTQVSGFLSKFLDLMQREAWCLHGRGVSQKPGKKIKDIKFWFSIFWARQRQILNSLFLCGCFVLFVDSSETWGSERSMTTSALWALQQKFPDWLPKPLISFRRTDDVFFLTWLQSSQSIWGKHKALLEVLSGQNHMQDFEFKSVWPKSSFIFHLLNHSFSWLINKYMLRAALCSTEDIRSDGKSPFK